MSAPRSFRLPRPGVIHYMRKPTTVPESCQGWRVANLLECQQLSERLESQGILQKKHMEMEMACKASEQRTENLEAGIW